MCFTLVSSLVPGASRRVGKRNPPCRNFHWQKASHPLKYKIKKLIRNMRCYSARLKNHVKKVL